MALRSVDDTLFGGSAVLAAGRVGPTVRLIHPTDCLYVRRRSVRDFTSAKPVNCGLIRQGWGDQRHTKWCDQLGQILERHIPAFCFQRDPAELDLIPS
jgi:hypothetical protein